MIFFLSAGMDFAFDAFGLKGIGRNAWRLILIKWKA
jgi:hypothetical protein